MIARKLRIRVVLDTNVFVRNFKSRSKASANRIIVRQWLIEKRLQLIVSVEVIGEYLEIFDEVLAMDGTVLEEWHTRFHEDPRITLVNLARRDTASRDPDDNVFLSTARAGMADFLITNDRDLLDIPEPIQKEFPFTILTPETFLAQLDDQG